MDCSEYRWKKLYSEIDGAESRDRAYSSVYLQLMLGWRKFRQIHATGYA